MIVRTFLRRPSRHLPLLLAAVVLAACEHPIAVVTPHLEASDVILRSTDGRELARTVDNRSWTGAGPELIAGDSLGLVVRFLDFQGQELDLNARADLQVRLEFEEPAAGFWEPLDAGGRLFALATGDQRIRVLVWHLDHVDFVTPWLDVRVADSDSTISTVPRSLPSLLP